MNEQSVQARRSPPNMRPIGFIRSALKSVGDAPRQGSEGAPGATLEIAVDFQKAVRGLTEGCELFIITWLDRADNEVLEVHPRDDLSLPLTGVFATRSPDRPNPIGLHRVRLDRIDGLLLGISPIEAVDGTPVLDIKPVIEDDCRSICSLEA